MQEIIEVWEKNPSIHAFTDLMNRTLDDPKEQNLPVSLQMPQAEVILERLSERRKRVAGVGGGP